MRASTSIAVVAAAVLASQAGVAQTTAPSSPGSATGAGAAPPPASTAPVTTAPSAASTPGAGSPSSASGSGAPSSAASTTQTPAAGAAAPGTTAAAPAAASAAAAAPTRELAVSGIIEKDLMGPDGKAIGDIEKVVESTSDQKKYLVVSSGGILGFFESQVAVPLDRVAVQNDQIVVRDMTDAQLKALPKFDDSGYRDLGDTQKIVVAEKK